MSSNLFKSFFARSRILKVSTFKYFAFKPGNLNNCDQQVEQPKLPNLWWYQSCASHGCNMVGGDYFHGWPSYMIDVDAVANRIMQWLTWKYDVKGELTR
jgi:hypothetical protein